MIPGIGAIASANLIMMCIILAVGIGVILIVRRRFRD